jgi:hypothetical protein
MAHLKSKPVSRILYYFILLGSIVLTFTQISLAKTTKQKRLHVQERYSRPQEVGRSVFGIKVGFFTSNSENNRYGGQSFSGEGINSSVSFDARVSPSWYLGTSIDIGRGKGSSALFNMNFLVKTKMSEDANSGIRFGYGPGFAFIRSGTRDRTAYLSNKFVIEGLYQTRAKFGWVGDLGVSFFQDIQDTVDASVTQIFFRFGVAFL